MNLTISRWVPTQDTTELCRHGKLMEELGEMVSAAAAYLEALDARDALWIASSRENLAKEIADVVAQCKVTCDELHLSYRARVPAAVGYGLSPVTRATAVTKLIAAAGVTATVSGRCVIQGLDEEAPGTGGQTNRARLVDSFANLLGACNQAITALEMPATAMVVRALIKEKLMHRWAELLKIPAAPAPTSALSA